MGSASISDLQGERRGGLHTAIRFQRHPNEGHNLIRSTVSVRLVSATPGLKREAGAGHDAGPEVEEALASELPVGRNELELR
jgi:hypothetical protein